MGGLVIIGGSYAAMNIAVSARQHGFGGAIRILSDESYPPYHRPPLSKGYLLGEVDVGTLPLRGESFYQDNHIEVVLDTRVNVVAGDGWVDSSQGRFAFDKLAFATGSRARLLRCVA